MMCQLISMYNSYLLITSDIPGGQVEAWMSLCLNISTVYNSICWRDYTCCLKVMFSQACLKNSVLKRKLGGGCASQHAMDGGGVCLPLGPGSVHPPRQTPPGTATAADGTHPIGIHSCCVSVPFQSVTLSKFSNPV